VLPFHPYASAPLGVTATEAHERMTRDVAAIVEAATADAITGTAPFIRAWGLSPTALPGVTARGTAADELGGVEVSWTGAEDEIAWPALRAQLLITPRRGGGSRLSLLSVRSPEAELRTRRIGSVHRRRLVDVALQRFLRHLADQLDDPGPIHRAAGAARVDRTPLFVHHLRPSGLDPDAVLATLTDAPDVLAARITDQVSSRARTPLAAGRFRFEPDPTVEARLIGPNGTGALHVGWSSNEEATGWPQLQLAIGVEATARGSRLMVLAAREPGYDLSRNRVDKAQRHQVLREFGAHVADAVLLERPDAFATGADELPTAAPRDVEVPVRIGG
jgi:hypothetical protein